MKITFLSLIAFLFVSNVNASITDKTEKRAIDGNISIADSMFRFWINTTWKSTVC